MKTSIIYLCIAAFVAFLLSSCGTSKNSLNEFAYHNTEVVLENITENNASSHANIVEFLDGTKVQYQSLKLVTGIFVSPHLLADGNNKLATSKIKAYNDGEFYAVSQKLFYDKAKAHVATDVLPGFAIREVKGNLNLFTLQFHGSGNVYKKYFLQKGDDGKILPITKTNLKEILVNEISEETINKISKKKVEPKIIYQMVGEYNATTSLTYK
jgi:hypothetical protein